MEQRIPDFTGFLNEARVDQRMEYEGLKYLIMFEPPRGYFVKGGDTETKSIFDKNKQFFATDTEAQEHAELEIDGYLKIS